MNKPTTIVLATLALALWQPASAQQPTSAQQAVPKVQTLRGVNVDDADMAPEEKPYLGKYPGSQKKIARTFTGQPPLIPHTVEGFPAITLELNRCLFCHEDGLSAPKPAESHFKDRDGKSLTDVSPARRHCTSCHVPQTDAKPLVENIFNGVVVEAKKAVEAKKK
ncbi:MAG: hypothetical protein A3J29_15615 [Acidobacteria bacterium RIFCSPLOWO2_12_FULL_67_14b]|nr:MAG: hypothetical protein A3H95_12490 [Acidobacteria bacterium RIFCSPLOWO2_02_FULL_64_15]OFW41318.1 MAG: hypothetical protein A3J29_15615 [Acidobacteria bacterium RIFCSPLOWO2_12_FULL_67_14b]